jgi:ABC-type antimicrobial peptide transport system permease subunit
MGSAAPPESAVGVFASGNAFSTLGMSASLVARLTTLFDVLALVLAAIGHYGVTAYTVERRTAEIGIRTALVADQSAVLRMILHGALVQVGFGIAIGLPVALLGANATRSQLYGVAPTTPSSWHPRRWSSSRSVLAAVLPA